MPDDPYTLNDLARLADVTPRTVRYYVSQGLLPSPDAAGPATRYGEAHLARLRLIKRLQRDHLPLAEIRLRLERLRDDEVIATVSALDARPPEPPSDPGDTLAFVRSLMAESGVKPTVAGGAMGISVQAMAGDSLEGAWAAKRPLASAPPMSRASRVAREISPMVDEEPAPPPSMSVPDAPARPDPSSSAPSEPVTPDRSTWERLVISRDVELHIRRPLDRRTNKRVDQLERIARELFEDD